MLITVQKLNKFLDLFDFDYSGLLKDDKIYEAKKIIKNYKIPQRYLDGLDKDEKFLRQLELVSKKRKPREERFENLESDTIARKKGIPKKGSCTTKWNSLYKKTSNSQKSKITGIPKDILDKVENKGRGAFYSSGSRPGQSAQSWGISRVNCFILNKPSVTKGPDKKLYEESIKRSPKSKTWFKNTKW